MNLVEHLHSRDTADRVSESSPSHKGDIARCHLPLPLERTWMQRFDHSPSPRVSTSYMSAQKILTLHLKQSRWNVPPSARTNCPVKGSLHFLQIRSCPLPFLVERCLELLRSLSSLVLGTSIVSLSLPFALNAGEPLLLSVANAGFGRLDCCPGAFTSGSRLC